MIETLLIAPFAIILMLAVSIPVSLYFAWAASHLWLWFVVPALGAPPLSILQIWGICLTLSMLRPKIDFEKTNNESWQSGVVAILIGPPLAVGLGWVVKNWWM